MRQCFLSLLPMQLGILQISLNSSAIRSHISEVGTVLCILVSVPSKWLFRTHVQCPVLYSFQPEKSIPMTQVIPHWQDTWNRLPVSDSQKCKDKWHNLTFWRRNYFFLILAHPVYKMWIIQEPNTLELWNKLHFEEEKNGEYIPCLKYSVPIFVE